MSALLLQTSLLAATRSQPDWVPPNSTSRHLRKNAFLDLLRHRNTTTRCRRFCPCCGNCLEEWAIVETRGNGSHAGHALGLDARPAQCSRCRSRERHRFSCLIWALAPVSADSVVAYFGPQRAHARQLERGLSLRSLLRYDAFAPAYAHAYENSTVFADLSHKIPRRAKSVDASIILHVLEHVDHVDVAVAELSRISRPGAFVDVETPCRSRPRDDVAYVACDDDPPAGKKRRRHTEDWVCAQPDHKFSYSCWYLLDLFEAYDFDCGCLHLSQRDQRRFVGVMAFDDWHLRCFKRSDHKGQASRQLAFWARHRLSDTTLLRDSDEDLANGQVHHPPGLQTCVNLSSSPLLARYWRQQHLLFGATGDDEEH